MPSLYKYSSLVITEEELLEMVIFTKTTDPQFGETVYRVTNVKRADPEPSLFKVPSDFKLQEPTREPLRNRMFFTPGEHI